MELRASAINGKCHDEGHARPEDQYSLKVNVFKGRKKAYTVHNARERNRCVQPTLKNRCKMKVVMILLMIIAIMATIGGCCKVGNGSWFGMKTSDAIFRFLRRTQYFNHHVAS